MARKRRSKNKKRLIKKRSWPRKLKEKAFKDILTGLFNYQYFIEKLDDEIRHAKRFMFTISMIMIDIDYFKSINDTYGYRIGNNVLKEFAQCLKKSARVSDIVARYGGAEFAILLHDTDKDGAVTFAERLSGKIQRRTFNSHKNKVKLKVSMGVVNFPDDGIDNVLGFINAVEHAVREAKEEGGNRVSTVESVIKTERIQVSKSTEIESLRQSLKRAGKKLDQALLESVYAFAKAIEARDHYTGEHAEKMVAIVRAIGKELGLPEEDIQDLEHAAVLHDLGKIGIDDRILRKKGKLTKKEFSEIKKHPRIGAEIIRSIHFLKDIVPLILYHHERFDGKGYTTGLKGKGIPMGARVLALADVYQALISDRPYRKAFSRKDALTIIKQGSGTQFDPVVVNALFKLFKRKNKRKNKKRSKRR